MAKDKNRKHDNGRVRKDTAGISTEPRYRKPKVVKAKGPTPDFTPNQKKAATKKAEEARQQTIATIRADEWLIPAFIKGDVGNYFIGILGKNLEGHPFEIRLVEPTHADGKPVTPFLGIFGKEGVYVRHADMFRKIENVYLVPGYTGDIQYGMLNFLKRALSEEIYEAKQAWVKEKKTAQNIIPSPNTKEGRYRPIQDLLDETNPFGRYGIEHEGGMVILLLRQGNKGNEFLVTAATGNCTMNVYDVIRVETIAETHPDLDTKIRELIKKAVPTFMNSSPVTESVTENRSNG